MTAEFVLTSSLCVCTMVNIVSVRVTGVPPRKCRLERKGNEDRMDG